VTPHVWEPAGAWVADRLLLRRPPTDLVCRRCGTRVDRDHAAKVDRVGGWNDCDEMLVESVMGS
jgi:hypothetical protein